MFTKRNQINHILQHESLEDLIENTINNPQLINETDIFLIFHAIVKKLEEIHKEKIFYGRLTPKNIHFEKDKKILTITFCGNSPNDEIDPNFSAPEVINGEIDERYVQKYDIYSFGRIIYYLLTKRKSLETRNKNDEYEELCDENKTIVFPENVPPFFSHLISLTLENNPEDRPSINEIAEILDSGLIFPSITENRKELNYYLKFTGKKGQNNNISYEILKNLENKFINKYRKDRLATVITLYLADYFDDTKAQREIGINYYDGIKFEKDGKKAFEYITVSAEKHDEKALFYLAQCYINGIGCEKNRDKAKIYLERSKNKGYK